MTAGVFPVDSPFHPAWSTGPPWVLPRVLDGRPSGAAGSAYLISPAGMACFLR
jgi:hypothetical protein